MLDDDKWVTLTLHGNPKLHRVELLDQVRWLLERHILSGDNADRLASYELGETFNRLRIEDPPALLELMHLLCRLHALTTHALAVALSLESGWAYPNSTAVASLARQALDAALDRQTGPPGPADER